MLPRSPPAGAWRRLLAAAWLLAAGASLPAQTAEPGWYRMGNWQQLNGLPQNWVMSLLQTRDGYIWIGTRGGGLARFDGVNFTTFDDSKPGQLTETEVWALAEGADGSLWIATYSGGVARLQGGRFTTYTTANGLIDNFVTSLATDPAGGIWMATNQGVSRFKDGRFQNFGARDGAAPGARVIYAEPDGAVWAATDRGELFHFDRDRFVPAPEVAGPLPTDEVRAFLRDRGHSLWVTSARGLFRIHDGQSRRYTSADGLSADSTYRVLEDRKGNLWVSTASGLDRYRPDTDSFQSEYQFTLRQPIFGLIEDNEGSLWIGGRSDGLARLHQGVFVSYTRDDGMPDDSVSAVMDDQTGRVWLGSFKGLQQFKDGKFTLLDEDQGMPRVQIVSLGKDRAGHLWVGTAHGLYRSRTPVNAAGDDGLPRFEAIDAGLSPRMHVRTLCEDHTGTMWIATNLEGLASWRDGRLKFYTTADGLAHNAVRGLAEDRDGNLWVGTRAGLCRFRDGRFTTFTTKDGLAGDVVQTLYLDHAGDLWIGTRRGVTRLSHGRFFTVTAADGLLSNFVHGFVEDDQHRLWMTCSKGLSWVSLADFEDFAAHRTTALHTVAYGREHGLRSTGGPAGYSPVLCKAGDGRLWAAFLGAVSVIRPEALVADTRPPPVHLEDVFIDQQPFAGAAPAEAPPGRGDLEFHYTALSFLAPEKLRFKYRLDGYDRDWIDAGNRRAAYYSNIPPGDYTFRVIAANSEGVWNTAGDRRRVRLRPHFYETGWFYAAGTFGLVLAALGLHRQRTRNLLARQRRLAQLVDARTQELQHEVAEHQHTEAELRRYKERLEEQVAARTKALRENQELLQSILDSSTAQIFVRDLDGRFMLVNRRYAELCGTTQAAMIGKTCADFHPPHDAEAFRANDRRAIDARGPVETEQTVTLRGGAARACLSITCPLFDEAGRPYAVCGIATDITQMKQMGEQLRHSQKMEAIGRLAGGIAHDFNNLLTGINGYASLALSGLAPQHPLHEPLREILKAGERAGSLTRQLLAYSRKQVLLPRRWNLNVIAADMQALLKRIVGEDIDLVTTLPPGLWDVLVDRGQIEQIVLNLVVNARDAMPRGGRLVLETANGLFDAAHLAQHPGAAPGPHVMLAVSDTGVGMTPEVKARLFEPFFTTKEQGKGTGLGLSVVYGIVQQSGGTINVYSEPGHGTAFRLYFPRARDDTEAAAPAAAAPAEAPARGHETILLVEDEEFVRNFTRAALQGHGYAVRTARNGREALELLARAGGDAIDLVLTDAVMPDLGGRELGERLRETRPRLPVLYMSGYTETAFMRGLPALGEECFLQKPFSPSELLRKVRALLRQRKP